MAIDRVVCEVLDAVDVQTTFGVATPLYVRDDVRKATVMFLAPGPGADAAETLQRLAAIAYPATH